MSEGILSESLAVNDHTLTERSDQTFSWLAIIIYIVVIQEMLNNIVKWYTILLLYQLVDKLFSFDNAAPIGSVNPVVVNRRPFRWINTAAP